MSFSNPASDPLVEAVKSITSKLPVDRASNELVIGDQVVVAEGAYRGKLAKITDFGTSGSAHLQLEKGPHIKIQTSSVIKESEMKKKRSKKKKDDDYDDDDMKSKKTKVKVKIDPEIKD